MGHTTPEDAGVELAARQEAIYEAQPRQSGARRPERCCGRRGCFSPARGGCARPQGVRRWRFGLHGRRIPGTRANIDHIVVMAAGVFVVDAKRYVDKRPELRVEGGILRPRVERLMVGGRDRTKLVAAYSVRSARPNRPW